MRARINNLTLNEVNQALQEITEILKPLENGLLDLKSGRVTNAGAPIAPFDYVRQYDLDAKLQQVRTEIQKLQAQVDRLAQDLPATFRTPFR